MKMKQAKQVNIDLKAWELYYKSVCIFNKFLERLVATMFILCKSLILIKIVVFVNNTVSHKVPIFRLNRGYYWHQKIKLFNIKRLVYWWFIHDYVDFQVFIFQ